MEATPVKGLSYYRNLIETRFPPDDAGDKAVRPADFHHHALSVTITTRQSSNLIGS